MSPNYLVRNPSNSSFYFRTVIPVDLQTHFGGKIEFRITLNSGNRSQSKKVCQYLGQVTEHLYHEVRMGKTLTIEEMKSILRRELERARKHSNWYSYVGVDRSKESTREEGLERLQREEVQLKIRSKKDFDDEVLEYLKREGITDIKPTSNEFRLFRENYIKIQNLKIKWKKEVLTGERVSEFDLVTQILDEGPEPTLEETETSSQAPPQRPQPQLTPPVSSDSRTLTEIRDRFIERRQGKVTDKLIGEYRLVMNDLIEIIGDLPAKSLTKKMISESYIETELRLPINRNKNPNYKDLPISEILKLKDITSQSGVNVNKYLGRLSTIFKWSLNQGYVNENVFTGMRVEISKSEQRKRREPFTTEELRKILSPSNYLKWTLSFKHKYSGQSSNHIPYYWVFLIGIFSGMRTNEICQLRVEDVFEDGKIWVFNVTESETTKVKTKSGIRRVPVHPTLISLGFIEYVQLIKEMKKERIFWELTLSNDGYQKQVTRHFNSRVLPGLGVWKKQTKVLYSTRHTFINKCYQSELNRDIIKYLVGHEPDFTIDVYGGNPFTTEQLYKEISKVKYSGVSFGKLKINWKKTLSQP
jgi:integrase